MSTINITSEVYNGWTYGGAVATLKGFATEAFTADDLTEFPAGVASGFPIEIACTVAGEAVTIPLAPLKPTTNSSNPDVRYVFDLYDSNDVKRVRFAVVRVPSDQGSPLTWDQLREFTSNVTPNLTTFAPLNSPHLTGIPTAPTAAPGTNSTQLATAAFIAAALAAKANLASPTFTGVPAVPTAAPGTNTTQAASTAFVAAAVPSVGGLAPLASPVFTGNPTGPTPSPGDNDTSLATTAFVTAAVALLAALASPNFSGNPTAPTPSAGDNDTSLATTAFVQGLGNGAKVYQAVVSQSSTSAPSATVLVNTIGVTLNWARTSAGLYTLTAASGGPFTANKTQIHIGHPIYNAIHDVIVYIERTSTSVITVRINLQAVGLSDDQMTEMAVSVCVYP